MRVEHHVGALERLARFFWGPIPWMIEIAAVLSGALRHWDDLAIILAMLFINAGVGFWQEFKADNAPGRVALPSWVSRTRWNNLKNGLAVRRPASAKCSSLSFGGMLSIVAFRSAPMGSHGSIATVTIVHVPEHERDAVAEEVHAMLAPFVLRHQIVLYT
jgi:hypothetical protein